MTTFARIMTTIAVLTLTSVTAWAESNSTADDTNPHFGGDDVPLPDGGKKPAVSSDGDPCDGKIDENNGVVTLTIKDASRAGKRSSIKLDEQIYAARFDASGVMLARAPMLHEHADLEWSGLNSEACHRRGLTFRNFRTTIIAALVWKGDVGLGLHVVEPPSGRIGGPRNYISPERTNRDHRYAWGDLQTFGEPGQGLTQVQLYTMTGDRNPGRGDLYFYVEFSSRGNPAQSPYCGEDPQGQASYQLIELDLGQRSSRGGEFPRVPCGKSWASQDMETSYLQRWPRLKL